MKRIYVIFMFALLMAPSVFAFSLDIKKTSENEVMVAGVDQPVRFTFEIKNLNGENSLEFYNLLGFSMSPSGKIKFEPGEIKTIELSVSPIGEFNHLGPYSLTYFVEDKNGTQEKRTLTFTRIKMDDAFNVGASSFDPDSNSINVYVENKINFDFGKMHAKFSSVFFDFEEDFELGPNEMKEFSVELNSEDFSKLLAGFYTMNVEISADDASTEVSSPLEFVGKEDIKTEEEDFGFIVYTKVIKKINEGNLPASTEVKVSKNIISRLFTSFEPSPDIVDREGFNVYYTWNGNLEPSETFEVSVKTNWIFPLILLVLVIAIVILAKIYTSSNLVIKKRVGFVKAKGGEFALKVTIRVHARKYMENINIIERLPPLVKVHERFGANQPTRVDEKARRIDWNFEKLEAGEIRIISYIIYSKVGVVGRFSLPATKGVYEIEGQIHETKSNRAFFIAEPRGKEDLEEE